MAPATGCSRDKETSGHTKTILDLPDGSRWVQLLNATALDEEGDMMLHCIGRGAYDEALRDNRAQFYSLRNWRGLAKVTAEVRAGVIRQCKGRANRDPAAHFRSDVAALIAHCGLEIVVSPDDLGLLQTDGQVWPFEELPRGLTIRGTLGLDDYGGLIRLPESLTVTSDLLANGRCGLFELPSGLLVGGDLELMYNVNLAGWDGPATIEGNAFLNGCTGLDCLPPGLRIGGTLDLSECCGLRELPVGLSVRGDLILPDVLAARLRPDAIRIGGAVINACADPPSTIDRTHVL